MTNNGPNQFMAKIKSYVKENWGAPFIIAFMTLLLSSAISLSAGSAQLADTIAIYAFYALVIGVLLQLICFLKYRKNLPESEAAL
jgi:amino acid transporter